ncbi:hypothetical protein N9P17_07625 [Tateyamaria sp.]|nr:hypothetical protein [Tateyamaria sp.]
MFDSKTHQSLKTPQRVCPVRSGQKFHKQIMTGSSHRQHKHRWAAVENQLPLKITSHLLRKSYSFDFLTGKNYLLVYVF